MTLYVISYDISDDKERRKISEIISDFGVRVQYSVFECYLKREQIEKLIEQIKNEFTESGDDSILIYKLCEKCKNKKENYGYKVEVKKYYEKGKPIII